MISLDKYSKSCNSVDDLCKKICVPSKTKDVNVKVFNMITNRNEEKTLEKQISCDFNANLIVQHVIQIKNWIMKHVIVIVKIIVRAKKL